MLGIALWVSVVLTAEPVQIGTIETPMPAGIFLVSSEFKIAPRISDDSQFLGVSAGGTLRFDLLHRQLRGTQVKTGKQLWQVASDNAIVFDHKIYNLRKNVLCQLDSNGQTLSRQRLPASVNWYYIDESVRFIAGFRDKPSKPHFWNLQLYDIRTKRVRELPIDYDLGGWVEPRFVSSPNMMVMYDVFETHIIKDMKVADPAWLRKRQEDYQTFDATVMNGRIYLLQIKVDSDMSELIDVADGRVLMRSQYKFLRFVPGRHTKLLMWGFEEDQVTLFAFPPG